MAPMYAIMTVTGADRTGIIAAVANALAERDINILDVSQTLMDKWFTMILRIELPDDSSIVDLQRIFDELGESEKLEIRVQSEAIFKAVNEI